jgi:4-hydroxythreonine-4-phosphate dehydrogenase
MGNHCSQESIRLAITCGEPGGIGAEAVLKALCGGAPSLRAGVSYLLIGPRQVWLENADLAGVSLESEGIELLDTASNQPLDWRWGEVTDGSAKVALEAVLTAGRMALNGEVDGIVTAPLTKEGLQRAGCDAPGHTELLGSLCPGSPRPTMMFASEGLNVVLVTTHLPLSEVSGNITQDTVLATIEAAHNGLVQDFGLAAPRIGVCGLNPHAGENGQLGTEEIREIIPALDIARERGINISGPEAADALFARTAKGVSGLDVIISMYHDQGLTAFKFAHFDDGVNVTLGLPLVRTSPDHGTALEIAGQGVANPGSTLEAISLAARIAQVRKMRKGRTSSPSNGDD